MGLHLILHIGYFAVNMSIFFSICFFLSDHADPVSILLSNNHVFTEMFFFSVLHYFFNVSHGDLIIFDFSV